MKVQANGTNEGTNKWRRRYKLIKLKYEKKIWIHDIKQIDLRLILVKTLMVDLVGWLCKVIGILG